MAAPPLLLLQNIKLTFGGTPLLTDAELSVGARERIALVGRNGSGKSTLLKIAAGLVEPDSGERFVQPSVTIRYLAQEPDLTGFASVASFVEAGLAPGDDAQRARRLLTALGLSGDESPATLSGGEARRAALVRALASEPDILLLDEPTNHLDIAAIEELEAMLAGLSTAMVLVSHDRRFLDNLSTATVWLDRGRTRRLGEGFAAFEAWRDIILDEEELAAHKLERKIVEEEHWLRYGVTARRRRNQRRLASLIDMRKARKSGRAGGPQGDVKMALQEARLSGRLVIEAEDVAKSFGGRPVVSGLDIRIERGDRLGIVGPNGAGKTTILNLLTAVLEPDAGNVRIGANVDLAGLDQRRITLDPEATVADTLTDGRGDTVIIGNSARHVIGYMKDFLFRPEQARTPVKALSGGERGRLMLARALARPSNLLVLDEPTNDLDFETLDLLQETLTDYPGTLLLVSHDRDFLDRIVTSVLAAEGNGRWTEYAGGYSDMVAQRGHGIGRKPPAKPERAVKGSAPAKAKEQGAKRKLSFSEQQALKTLPARISVLGDEVARLEAHLSEPDFYARDPSGFAAASQSLAKARAGLDAAESEWLRVELLREELEGR